MNTLRLARQSTHRLVALALAAVFTLATAGGIDRLSAPETQPLLQATTSAPAQS